MRLLATAAAHPNIAFIKYWGNRDEHLRLPTTGSISMNLACLETRTRVVWDESLAQDQLTLNGTIETGPALTRVAKLLEDVRQLAGWSGFAQVDSENNFPTGAGIASSASAFAALALASSAALGLELEEAQLSRLARRASGSACRSIPGGFVEWQAGQDDLTSYAFSIASPDHWELADCVAIVSQGHKTTGSSQGHMLAGTSPLQTARIQDAPRRLDLCRQAVCNRDFELLAETIELDSNWMHAVMMTSHPALLYWEPPTLAVMQAVVSWRKNGLPVAYTIDAGPNVHVITLGAFSERVAQDLAAISGVSSVLIAAPGHPAHVLPTEAC